MNRRSTIAIAFLLAGCGGGEAVVRIEDFEARSELVACAPLPRPVPDLGAVTQLQAATDTTFVVVDDRAPAVALLDRDLRRIGTLPLHAGADIGRLADAAPLGDTLVVVADAGLQRLRAFSMNGEQRWSLDLSFPPQRVAFAGGRLIVAAVGMDGRIPSLLYELQGAALRPLGVPFAPHPDALSRMFVNTVTLQGFPDGRAIAAHQFVLPRAWRISARGLASRAGVPMAARAAAEVGFMPPMPLRTADLERIAVPVIASTADPATGGLIYLTRSGARTGTYAEKALVRTDSLLAYTSSVRIAPNAVALVLLPASPDSVLVVDARLDWYRCPAPARGGG